MDARTSTKRTTSGLRSGLLAITALLATAALVVVVVIFLVNNAGWVALGMAGLLLVVAGGWWMLTEKMPRRAVGLAGLVAGVAAMIGGFAGATGDLGQFLLHLLVTVGLLLVAGLAAGAALNADVAEVAAAQTHRRASPVRPVLICNPKSCGGKVERFGLVDLADSLGVETVTLEPGLDLEKLAIRAVEGGADCLGMAGGDGSQALVASIAVRYGLPFVCVSAGTRNHFALDLGLNR